MANELTVTKPQKETKLNQSDDHALVLAQFEDSENSSIESRAEAEVHRRYYDGHQWTDEEIKILESRGQPVITDNKIKDKVEFLLGLERKTRTDPKAFPRNMPTDEKGADAATDALRFVHDQNMFHYVRSDVAENMFIEGVGGVEIVIDKKYGGRQPKVCVRRIRWDRLYWDAHSMECDFLDAMYKGFITWMDLEVAVAKWLKKRDILEACFDSANNTSQTHDDKPRFTINTAGRKRVQVFTHYYKKGDVWYHCIFVKAGFLEEPTESAYQNEFGDTECPLEFQAMYRQGEDGAPYGAIRRYRDLQDDWNKRRSKSLHLLNTNQVIMEDGAVGDSDPKALNDLRREAARPDGVIRHIQGMKLELRNNLDLAVGHTNLMMLTGQALEATGPNAALQGVTGSISGRAKQVDQQGGQIQIDKPFDSIRYLTLRVYKQIWNRIRQYWTQEMWVRVRDEEQVRFIGLNQPRYWADIIAEELAKQQIPDEEKQAILQRIAADPKYRQVIIQNHVPSLDVDITIDEGPDVVTLQQEQFETLAGLAKSGVPIPPKALIEASSLRNKRKILDAMGGGDDPAAQQMAAMQQRLATLEAMLKEAQARKIMSEVQKNEAAAIETQVDTSVKLAQFTNGEESVPAGKTAVTVN